METFNNITLEYKNEKKDKYMGLSDLAQDLTTDTLLKILPTLERFNDQMTIMNRIEKRSALTDNNYFKLLETCNAQ